MMVRGEMYPSIILNIPESECSEIERYSMGSKVSGTFNFEVVARDENSIDLKIKSIMISPNKRIV